MHTHEVSVGETVLVRPGERIPLDGEIIEGGAGVDESSFTGESVPATKETGSQVIGGTLNLDGSLTVRVTKVGTETFLNQVVRLMTQIAERKPPIELLADRLMNYYGPVVFAVATLAFVGWVIGTAVALGAPAWVPAVIVLLTVIIMGYPCALGISTPMLAAIVGGKGISIGLLVKASEVFHELSTIDTIVFDKTGTLTYGRPTVTDVVPLAVEPDELLRVAGAVEEPSEHPLGQSIAFYAKREGVEPPAAEDFRAVPGKGVSGTVDGAKIIAGRPSFVEESAAELDDRTRAVLDTMGREGKTVVAIARDGKVIGLIALQDTPRRGVEQTVRKLRGRGIRTAMLTGDSKPVAEAIGRKLGIDEVHAELLPDEKVAAIRTLQNQGRKVAMVGDGINDAPALAQADAGIAIAAGTDVAIESASVILVGDRIDDVLNALTLGKAAYRTLTGNVIVAVLFNVAGVIAAAAGAFLLLPHDFIPVVAIAVMIASIVVILLNTLRVRAIEFEREEVEQTGPLAEVEYRVPTMVCEGCAEKISEALRGVPGVQEVKPKVAQKHVLVRYEPARAHEPQLKQALGKAGFVALEA